MRRPCTLASAGVLILTLAACGEAAKPAAPPPPPVVTVTPVIERSEAEWEVGVGRLEAPELVEVRPRVAGFIDKMLVKDGALVAVGDVLLELDPRPFQVQTRRAAAQLAEARANLGKAQRDVGRAQQLLEKEAISKEEADNRTSAVAAQQATVAAAEAALASAQLDLDYTRVTSPLAGRVGRITVSAGNLAGPNGAAVATVVSSDPIYATVDLDERSWLAARPLLTAADAKPLPLMLDGESGWPHQARFAFADNRVDPATGTMRIRATLPNPDGALPVGGFVRLHVPVAAVALRLLVDERAIGTDQSNRYVLVLEDGKAVYHKVTLGPAVDGGLRIVRSGVKAGDGIIFDIAKVRQGAAVTVKAADSATAGTQPASGTAR